MSTRLKRMKELATVEAKNLKKHATQEELNELNLENVDPDRPTKCIYGLMTDDCYSDRAAELIQKCCTKVYKSELRERFGRYVNKSLLNGAPTKIPEGESRKFLYHSPIEVLIFGDNGGEESIKKLVPYLKGETKTLKL